VDHQPRPAVCRKKRRRDRLIRLAQRHPDWLLGFEDEVWWSRLSFPALRAWTDADHPLRLVEQTVAKSTTDASAARKALACYGLLVRDAAAEAMTPDAMWLRFVAGRPISAITTRFLAWCAERTAARGKTALLLIWDNASWHISKEVRAWLRTHNQQVKTRRQGARILVCPLPSKSPWLNPIEPKWVHGKRAVVEPDRLLPITELEDRVCAYYGCDQLPHLTLTEEVA
jgi:DDE superfamily endonuclease